MHNLKSGEKKPRDVGRFWNFQKKTSKNQQSPIGRKFAQSGHPGAKLKEKQAENPMNETAVVHKYTTM
jgi:hypothetical protein